MSPEKEMDDNTEKTENIENGNVQNECGALFCRALGAKTDHSIPPISFDWTADTTDLSEDIQNNSPLSRDLLLQQILQDWLSELIFF